MTHLRAKLITASITATTLIALHGATVAEAGFRFP